MDILRRHRHERPVTQQRRQRRLAAGERHRHPMHVARRRRGRRVEIGMGVQPQHEQLAVGIPAMPGHGADRPHRQAVIAAHEHRNPPALRHLISAVMDQPGPGGDMPGIPASPGVISRQPVIGRRRMRQIAMIGHVVAHFTEQRRQPRRPQRRRPHDRAGLGGAKLQRNAEKRHAARCQAIPLKFTRFRLPHDFSPLPNEFFIPATACRRIAPTKSQ